jgi:phosphate transport system protein
LRAMTDRDERLAQRVLEGDEAIDRMELELEEECLHTLALYQPMAFQLRFVVALIKINNQLERIGDLSVNIAEQIPNLARHSRSQSPDLELERIGKLVESMLKRALDSLAHLDPLIAQGVRASDLEVDLIHESNYKRVENAIKANPEAADGALHILSVSRYLERVGDHAVNVAENVVYISQGEILRHTGKPKKV